MQVTIYHNPDCGTSCNALANIRNLGHEPRIVEYLKTPLSRAEIVALLARMDIPARNVVRRKEPLFQELGLDEKDVTQDELLDALAENPILINRPIVVVQDGTTIAARLCRPSALVTSLLHQAPLNS
jgi:arsenate reductase (glutaredoxin)